MYQNIVLHAANIVVGVALSSMQGAYKLVQCNRVKEDRHVIIRYVIPDVLGYEQSQVNHEEKWFDLNVVSEEAS